MWGFHYSGENKKFHFSAMDLHKLQLEANLKITMCTKAFLHYMCTNPLCDASSSCMCTGPTLNRKLVHPSTIVRSSRSCA